MKRDPRNKKVRFFIPIKTVTACFAKWAVKQSPYRVPDNLERAVGKFHEFIEQEFAEYICLQNEWIDGKISRKTWDSTISSIILNPNFLEVAAWNERKNGNKSQFNFICVYNPKPDPDNDFIDLHALARNIENETWHEGNIEDYSTDAKIEVSGK